MNEPQSSPSHAEPPSADANGAGPAPAKAETAPSNAPPKSAPTEIVAYPPPVLLGGLFFAGLLLTWWFPLRVFPTTLGIIFGPLLILGGLGFLLYGNQAMQEAGTGVKHREPTTALVQDGPFRFSRNPIYLGMALLMGGVGFAANSPWLVILAGVFGYLMQRGVIDREEEAMKARFGDAYDSYRRKVRRWL